MYILSSDLATSIVEDAIPFSSFLESEGVEDHDIGTMAYVRSEGKPMNLIMLSKKALFWDHPVKRKHKRWGEKWRNEISRARTVLLPQNSTTSEEHSSLALTTRNAESKKKEQISFLEKLDVGWSFTPPEWMHDICPDVVTHYNRFPSFKEREPGNLRNLPFFPTNDVAQAVSSFCQQQLQSQSRMEIASLTYVIEHILLLCYANFNNQVCTIKIVQVVAASINARVYLHAGSHLGAVVHGQPIPWDDDVDLIMDYRYSRDLEIMCQGDGIEVHASGVRLRCASAFNSLKVWLHPKGHKKMTRRTDKHYSPFVDLFAFEIDGENVKEVFLDVNSTLKPNQSYPIKDFFPTRPYYFAGTLKKIVQKLSIGANCYSHV